MKDFIIFNVILSQDFCELVLILLIPLQNTLITNCIDMRV